MLQLVDWAELVDRWTGESSEVPDRVLGTWYVSGMEQLETTVS